MKKLDKYLCNVKKLIDVALDKYLPAASEEPKAIHRAMRYSVFSCGKRIRPILVIECAKACGGRAADAMPAACAVELIHTYSLIHDDLPCMDDDDFRRGRPACHKVFGEADALLAAGALFTLAFRIMSTRMRIARALPAIAVLSEAAGTNGLVGGQAFDLDIKKRRNKKNIELINTLKTARLFEASAELGAISAGASKKAVPAMARYGMSLGMAFQMKDDLIDREGYAAVAGHKQAEQKAELYSGNANLALKIFGSRGTRLREITSYLMERIK